MQQSKEVKFFSPERTAFPIKSDIIHSIFRESAFDMRPLGSDVGEAEAQLRTLHDEDAVIVSQSEEERRELLQSKELLRPNNRWWRCSLSTRSIR